MDASELGKILDGLDKRLALGEIDMGTYNSLKAKFTSQMQETGAGDPFKTAMDAMPQEAVALKCPGCMNNLTPPSDPSQATVACEYCGGTFALKAATDEMEKLKADIRKWVSEVAGGVSVGGTIDGASRQFIFKDKIFPSLKLAASRATEMFAMTRYGALFSFPLIAQLGSSPFQTALQTMPDSSFNYFVEKIKSTSARVGAPEVQSFAVGDKEKADLAFLELQCQETIFLSNVRRHVSSNSLEGYHLAQTNLQALHDLYDKVSKSASSSDPSLASFCTGLRSRMSAVKQAVSALHQLSGPAEGIATASIISILDDAAIQCENAASKLETSGREPKELIPAIEGTRNDAQTIRILVDCIRLFGCCGAEEGVPFSKFLDSLKAIITKAKEVSSDLKWLANFVSSLSVHMFSISGQTEVSIVKDFGWVDTKAAGLAKSSLFGGKEAIRVDKRIFMPFWLAELDFSKEKGMFVFKKGQAAQALLLLDATCQNGQVFVVPPENSLSPTIYRSVEAKAFIGNSNQAVVPVVNADKALTSMKNFINITPGYAGGYPKLIGIIYLSIALVVYSSKKGERTDILFPIDSAKFCNPFPKLYELGTQKVLLF